MMGMMMGEAMVQIRKFVYVPAMSSWVRTQKILIIFGKNICVVFQNFQKWSSVNEGVDWENISPNSVATMY